MKLYQLLTVLNRSLYVNVLGKPNHIARHYSPIATGSCSWLLDTLLTDDLFREVEHFDVGFPDRPVIQCGRSK